MRRGWLLTLLLLSLVLPGCQGENAPPAPDWRFGVVEAYESPDDAADLGASWTRVRFHWGEMQPASPVDWQPPVERETLQAEIAAGREVVGLIIGIPDWARDAQLLPQGLYAAPDDPNNTFAVFARRLTEYYSDTINHWIIWNEPDIWDKATPGHTWDGDERNFAQLQRTAYLTVKAVNPQATVHLPAMTYFWDANFGREQYLGRLLDVILEDPQAAAHNHYFDVATAHLYFQPDSVYTILRTFDEIIAERGLDKPLWLVETNAPPSDDPTWPVASVTLHVTLHDQAIYQSQALAVALAAGADRVAIYKLTDLDSDAQANPEPFGLVRQDGSRRPAFEAAQVAFRYMAGTRLAERERWDEIGQIRLEQGDRITHILFSRLGFPYQAEIEAIAPTALLVDMWGEATELRAEGGMYRVDLPKSDCSQPIADYCMIGGETYYLIQGADGGELGSPYPEPLPDAAP